MAATEYIQMVIYYGCARKGARLFVYWFSGYVTLIPTAVFTPEEIQVELIFDTQSRLDPKYYKWQVD